MTAKKTSHKKKRSVMQRVRPVVDWVKKTVITVKRRISLLLTRRPHRSFHQTRRRDYARSLNLPGYWAFTNSVRKMLWKNRRVFFWMMAIYAALTIVLVGMASQETYTELSDLLRDTSGEALKGDWQQLGQAGLLLVTGMTGSLGASLTEAQQIYAAILVFLTWLTTVWLLRAQLAGRKPKLRDALYNAGAPILPTMLVGLLMFVQLLPLAVATLGFLALLPYGIVDGGIEAMLFWSAAALLLMLSAYWLTSTLIALVVVTLPGMYPMQAIRAAGDLVVGRRLRILFRLVWLLFVTLLGWVVVMVPVILFDTWLKGVAPGINWLPIIPVFLLGMSTITVLWAASYIYLFYRKVVDDDAAPA